MAVRTNEKERHRLFQRKAEKFFYNQILQDVRYAFQHFMNDGIASQFLSATTKCLIDDIIRSIGKVKIEQISAMLFFCGKEKLLQDIADSLQEMPRGAAIKELFLSNDVNKKYSIFLTLRPAGSERFSPGQTGNDPVTTSIIMDVLAGWIDRCHGRIDTMTSLITELERIKEDDFEQYSFRLPMISDLSNNVAAYKELIITLKAAISKLFARQETEAAAKGYYWEKIIIQSIELINDYCHNDRCLALGCDRIHPESIRKTAELLSIIHPHRFAGTLGETIVEIMARYFEIRSAYSDTDRFIRRLFSRYADDLPQ